MELPLVHLVLGLGRKGKALFESAADVQTIVDPKEAAESAGLRCKFARNNDPLRGDFASNSDPS